MMSIMIVTILNSSTGCVFNIFQQGDGWNASLYGESAPTDGFTGLEEVLGKVGFPNPEVLARDIRRVQCQ